MKSGSKPVCTRPPRDPANTSAFFSLKNAVVVYGGFAGTETSLDQRDWQANLTILSGDIDGNDVNTDGNFIAETPADIQGSNSIHVVWNSNVDPTAVLNGFVITAGKYVDVSLGAGMYNVNASPTLVHLTISGNSGYEGGGMFNHLDSSPTVTQVTFTGNSAVSGGGGIKNYSNSSPLLTNVVFSGNNAYNGGGMFSYASSPLLRNVLFKGNTATNGGGIYSYEGAPVLFNTTFSGNSAFDAGGAYQNGGSLTIHNSILWGDTATVTPEIKADSGTHHGGIQQHLRLRRIERLEQCLRGGWRRQYRHRSALPRLLRRGHASAGQLPGDRRREQRCCAGRLDR